MATFKSVFLTVIFVSASSAAPNNQKLDLKTPDPTIKSQGHARLQELFTSLQTENTVARKPGHVSRVIRSGTTEGELSPESDWDNCPHRTMTLDAMWTYSYSNKSDPDYIIQHDQLRQSVDIVTCAYDKIDTDSSQQCFQNLDLGSLSMKTSCRTITAKRSLLVLDYETKQLKMKTFEVPCCCSCQIIRS